MIELMFTESRADRFTVLVLSSINVSIGISNCSLSNSAVHPLGMDARVKLIFVDILWFGNGNPSGRANRPYS